MIKTLWGTKVRILAILPDFISDGKRLKRILVENIDQKSKTWGLKREINIENLIPQDKVEREIERLKNEI